MLASVRIGRLSPAEANTEIEKLKVPLKERQYTAEGNILIGGNGNSPREVNENQLREGLTNSTLTDETICQNYLQMYRTFLNGDNRVNLVAPVSGIDITTPVGVLPTLFTNPTKLSEARRIVFEAFEKYLSLDYSTFNQLAIKLSSSPTPREVETRCLDKVAATYFREAQPIDNASHGMKAFIGIIITLIAGDPKIILLDEPEAFLHPPLSHSLGKEIGKIASGNQKTVFIATHDARFLMGCLASGAEVNIVRLTYSGDTSTARLLSKDDLLSLMRDPLLRSTKVLEGLFYKSVVVTESDADRAFYEEINERLISENRGIPDAVFLNGQNKQTLHRIISPLRKMGIPAASIIDIDFINSAREFRTLLEASQVLSSDIDRLETDREAIWKEFQRLTTQGQNYKTDGGITLLDLSFQAKFKQLASELEVYGVFIITRGELESWLPNLGVSPSKHGPKWLIEAFEKMGNDPAHTNYTKPGSDDVWQFADSIQNWVKNPNKKGIPSL